MYRFSEAVSCSEVDGELVILDAASGLYFGLDSIGARMITVFLAAPSLEAAADTLSKEYDAPVEKLQDDLRALEQTLLAKGLVKADG
jgi:hypothetical protein